MAFLIKHFLVIFIAITGLVGMAPGLAFSVQMTIDAVDDAGQSPGQGAYLKLVYPSGPHDVTNQEVSQQWTTSSQVYSYASGIVPQDPPEPWELQSAGNIWSPTDLVAGDTLSNLAAGVYRVSVVDGAFLYDSFNWSNYQGNWWWQLHIQSSMLPGSVILGDTNPFGSAQSAFSNSFGDYVDIPVETGGSLTFWIWDSNSIDNSGSLTFDVIPIPEPSTFILAGTGLLFLYQRFRRSFAS
jgi:hypothetical protein